MNTHYPTLDFADGVGGIDLQFDVQAIVLQQYDQCLYILLISSELAGSSQIRVAVITQRHSKPGRAWRRRETSWPGFWCGVACT